MKIIVEIVTNMECWFLYPRYNREFSDDDILPSQNNSVSELQINGSPVDPGEIVYRPIWPKIAPVLSKREQ